MKTRKAWILRIGLLGILSSLILLLATYLSMTPVSQDLHKSASGFQNVRVIDRNGIPLGITYQDKWNSHDYVPLYEIPQFLKDAFITSEDRRFYAHTGMDWQARFGALWQNVKSLRVKRGASTITEQVVRMVNTRPRSLWARWVEGFEAFALESDTDKQSILEFYLNQVPYAANRRGVAQAARYYFNRDLGTLTKKEMLALVVLVRAPSAFDLYRDPQKINPAITRLASAMLNFGHLTQEEFKQIESEELALEKPSLPTEARHFARYVRNSVFSKDNILRSSLDSRIQHSAQEIIRTRLAALSSKNVQNAAVLVVDYTTHEVLAWVVAGEKAAEIDSVTTPRQPGSTLKPFLYAAALEKGWTAAKFLEDAPLTEAIGSGLHRFRNYSNTHYGHITLREALGNSLNIPALLAIRFVGAGDFLTILQKLDFQSLSLASDFYDEGLALGNGEVTLLELVQAYGTLANRGIFTKLRFTVQDYKAEKSKRIFSDESASLIADVLSDPWARRMEFGAGSVLNMPLQTAVKTGTSTDYRDAWAVGFNDRYLVGVWMGNLDRTPMHEVTGSNSSALALRSIFSFLNRERDSSKLYLSPRLVRADVCFRPQDSDGQCPIYSEFFSPENLPSEVKMSKNQNDMPELVRPTEGLQIAYDPRIPPENQKFRFEVRGAPEGSRFKWVLNGNTLEASGDNIHLWTVERGKFHLGVMVTKPDGNEKSLPSVDFLVK